MTHNCLVLEGAISRTPKQSVSPAGVPHCHFTLEHRSIQVEAGMNRQAFCLIQVVASGAGLESQTATLAMGMQIRVHGFLSSHKQANGLTKLVLHAQHIEQI